MSPLEKRQQQAAEVAPKDGVEKDWTKIFIYLGKGGIYQKWFERG